jgi:putative transposase
MNVGIRIRRQVKIPRKSYPIEEIISKLREAEVLLSQGQNVVDICWSFNISEQTYYRWRKEYGGIRTNQVRWLKELEKENARLKELLADLSLDNSILRETVQGDPGLMPGQAD